MKLEDLAGLKDLAGFGYRVPRGDSAGLFGGSKPIGARFWGEKQKK